MIRKHIFLDNKILKFREGLTKQRESSALHKNKLFPLSSR